MSKLQNMFALCSLFLSLYADTCAAGKFAPPFTYFSENFTNSLSGDRLELGVGTSPQWWIALVILIACPLRIWL